MGLSAPTYGAYWPTLAAQWDNAKISNGREGEVSRVAKRLFANKSRYRHVELITGVPWWMIAAIGEREAGEAIFSKQLGQGDPLSQVSHNEPAGIGPWYGVDAWERAAIFYLKYDHLSLVKDWRLEKSIYYWIRYNGWGYYQFHNRMPSPYPWGATTIQVRGKYTGDGHWDSGAWDMQIGCCAMLIDLMKLDPTIQPVRET